MRFNVLIADDEKNIREGLQQAVEMDGYCAFQAADGAQALKELLRREIDLVITDLRMPKLAGEELLHKIGTTCPAIPVIVLTGHGTVANAVDAMRKGAYDFITKPVHLDHLSLVMKRALASRDLIRRHKALQEELAQIEKKRNNLRIIGRSGPVHAIWELIRQVAPTRASVLITGESGVGKELVADAVHDLSPRRKEPFVKVHCAALPEALLESELFGHERGAFTGATGLRKGRFELAQGGSIFLDEIGEISQAVQIKILRVLQGKTFERVGGETTLKVDVRVIAATNKDLKEEIVKGRFREDLFYRLNVVNIDIPPLRERQQDIPLISSAFLSEFAEENGKTIEGIDKKAAMALYTYSWPGNVRELRNCLESAVIMCKDHLITLEDLPPYVALSEEKAFVRVRVGATIDEVERQLIQSTLSHTGGNKTRAAEILAIGRKTLHRKIHEYGLEEFLKGERRSSSEEGLPSTPSP